MKDITESDIRELQKRHPDLPIRGLDDKPSAKSLKRSDGYRSQLEADYAAKLEQSRRDGVITSWKYESIRFRLVDKRIDQVWYKPDFRITYPGGYVVHDEVKGFMREAARLRLLMAVEQYPEERFRLVTRKGGVWQIENIGRER